MGFVEHAQLRGLVNSHIRELLIECITSLHGSYLDVKARFDPYNKIIFQKNVSAQIASITC